MKNKNTSKHFTESTTVGGNKQPFPGTILTTKLYRPPVPTDIVPRTELLKQLDKYRNRPLTLISAPAGYGKSILISSWIEARKTPAAWISLDTHDNNLRIFLSYFVTAIKHQFPESLDNIGNLLEAVTLPTVTVVSQYLINELDEIGDEFTLVLDDYHCIEDKPIHDLIEILLQYPPQNLRLVILSRKDPPLQLHNLRAYGQLNELRMNELSFTSNEIILLFQKLHGFTISDEVSKTILERTEGWITGLWLAALSIKGPEDMQDLLESMESDSLHSVSEFLLEEVLFKQSERVQQYLLKTSMLNRFCAELLDEVYLPEEQITEAIPDGDAFLDWLEKSGMFVIPLDLEHHWFRYHQLFQELLQNHQKKQLTPLEVKADHLKAAVWFEKNGFIEESIEHALAAGEVEKAAQVVERNRQSALNADKMYLLDKWLSLLPDTVVKQRPELLLGRAWVFHHQLRYEAIPALIDRVESLLKNDSRPHLQGEAAFFRGYFQFFLNEGTQSLEYLRKAMKQVPVSNQEVRAQTEIFFGLVSQMEGQEDQALHTLKDLLNSHPLPSALRKTRLLATHMYIHIISGDLRKAESFSSEFNQIATNRHFAYAAAWSHYLPGLIHFLRYELDKSIAWLRISVEQRLVHHARAAVDSFTGLMLAYQASGESEEAEKTQQLLTDYVAFLDDPVYTALADACKVRLALLQGKPGVANRWLETSEPPAPEVMIWWLEVPCITHCRALIAEGSVVSLNKAEERLREYMALNQAHHNTCQLIHILPLLSLACEKQGRAEEALRYLEQAVKMAEPGAYIFPFLELGSPMVKLLERLVSRGKGGYYVEKLLDTMKGKKSRSSQKVLSEDHGDIEPISKTSTTTELEALTPQEMKIVTHLVEGLNNQDIADELFISLSTVKSHVYNIYQKWNVKSRVAAAEKARRLGIQVKNSRY